MEFKALFTKGNVLKITLECLLLMMSRANIVVDDTGIMVREIDDGQTILADIKFQRENLKDYVCAKKRILNVCLKQFCKQLRNVKKKDSVTLFIEPGSDELGILIQPEDNKNESFRSEKNFITFTENTDYSIIDIPEIEDYHYPVNIEASEFQKIKKMISSSRRIHIEVHNSSFISFTPCDAELLKSTIYFGPQPEKVEYSADFNSMNVNVLIKFPGMCSNMQFYSPKDNTLPLKVKIDAVQNNCIMGAIYVYIKDCNNIMSSRNVDEIDTGVKLRREKKKK
jgi:hypothetical protein